MHVLYIHVHLGSVVIVCDAYRTLVHQIVLLSRPSLSHQRPQEDKEKRFDGVNKWYKRGIDSSKTAIKFRKGACENCGSMTHKKKGCLEVV